MGKGDKKTRRGKIIIGSSGKLRRKKKVPAYVVPIKKTLKKEKVVDDIATENTDTPVEKVKTAKKPAAKKKAPAKKKTTVKKVVSETKEEKKTEIKEKTKAVKKPAAKKKAPAKKTKTEEKVKE